MIFKLLTNVIIASYVGKSWTKYNENKSETVCSFCKIGKGDTIFKKLFFYLVGIILLIDVAVVCFSQQIINGTCAFSNEPKTPCPVCKDCEEIDSNSANEVSPKIIVNGNGNLIKIINGNGPTQSSMIQKTKITESTEVDKETQE